MKNLFPFIILLLLLGCRKKNNSTSDAVNPYTGSMRLNFNSNDPSFSAVVHFISGCCKVNAGAIQINNGTFQSFPQGNYEYDYFSSSSSPAYIISGNGSPGVPAFSDTLSAPAFTLTSPDMDTSLTMHIRQGYTLRINTNADTVFCSFSGTFVTKKIWGNHPVLELDSITLRQMYSGQYAKSNSIPVYFDMCKYSTFQNQGGSLTVQYSKNTLTTYMHITEQ